MPKKKQLSSFSSTSNLCAYLFILNVIVCDIWKRINVTYLYIQTKAQSFSTLHGTKALDPADSLEICDLTTDVIEVIERGKEYWEQVAEQNLELQKKTQETLGQGNGATQNQANNKSKENSGYKVTTYNNNMNKISDKKKKKDKDF